MLIFICALEENNEETLDNLHALEPKNSKTIGEYLDGYGHTLMMKPALTMVKQGAVGGPRGRTVFSWIKLLATLCSQL